MQKKSATIAPHSRTATSSENMEANSSRIKIDYEGLRTFNRFAFMGGSILLIAATVQAILFNRLLTNVNTKLKEHTALLQATNQQLNQSLQPLRIPLSKDATKGRGIEGQAAAITPNEIRTVQEALKQKGFYPGDTNGRFDNKTKSALKKYQSANNLPSEGATLEALLNLNNSEHIRQQMQ